SEQEGPSRQLHHWHYPSCSILRGCLQNAVSDSSFLAAIRRWRLRRLRCYCQKQGCERDEGKLEARPKHLAPIRSKKAAHPTGRVVMVDAFRTSRVSSANCTPSEHLSRAGGGAEDRVKL
ncbi:hypothetical protein HaLaN_32429, partial [Haematococcus lacustris]